MRGPLCHHLGLCPSCRQEGIPQVESSNKKPRVHFPGPWHRATAAAAGLLSVQLLRPALGSGRGEGQPSSWAEPGMRGRGAHRGSTVHT